MPRPVGCRRVSTMPAVTHFKPRGIPLRDLEVVIMSVDELEALRLADLEGLYQEDAAARMGISRQTFGRIVDSAHRKAAECLIQGKALEIEGGNIMVDSQRTFQCLKCQHIWHEPYGTGRPQECPECHSQSLRRTDAGAGRGPGHGNGQCRRRMRARLADKETTANE
jgi:predicted DNA-binding protein (UPF0251 family)